MMLERFRSFSLWLVIIAVGGSISLLTYLNTVSDNQLIAAALGWLSAIIGYQAFTQLLFTLGSRSKSVLSLFYGPMFLDGYWSYTSRSGANRYVGVWRIEQTLSETRVNAFGLDDDFTKRSSVQSVACELRSNEFVFVNERTDWNEDPDSKIFSKTTLIPDHVERKWLFFERPLVLRGETRIHGGPSSGHLSTNVVFRKHLDVTSFEALIEKLKKDERLWRDQD